MPNDGPEGHFLEDSIPAEQIAKGQGHRIKLTRTLNKRAILD